MQAATQRAYENELKDGIHCRVYPPISRLWISPLLGNWLTQMPSRSAKHFNNVVVEKTARELAGTACLELD